MVCRRGARAGSLRFERVRAGRQPAGRRRRMRRGDAWARREGAGLQQDRRVPARLDPGRHHRDPAARGAEQLRGRGDRGPTQFNDANLARFKAVDLAVHHRRRARRRPAGRVRALHPRRRRLRRHPRRVRHRVRLGLVRRPGRRVLRQPPGDPERDRQGHRGHARTRPPPACRSAGSGPTSGTTTAPTRARRCTCWPRSTRPRTPAASRASTTRSRGAAPTTAGAPGTPASATPRRAYTEAELPQPICSAASGTRPRASATAGECAGTVGHVQPGDAGQGRGRDRRADGPDRAARTGACCTPPATASSATPTSPATPRSPR